MKKGINNGVRLLGAIESVNPLKEPLTIEKLKTFEDFENTTDEVAREIIYTIDSLCRIAFEYLMHQKNSGVNNELNLAA